SLGSEHGRVFAESHDVIGIRRGGWRGRGEIGGGAKIRAGQARGAAQGGSRQSLSAAVGKGLRRKFRRAPGEGNARLEGLVVDRGEVSRIAAASGEGERRH